MLAVLLLAVAACSPPPPVSLACEKDGDCKPGETCNLDKCVAKSACKDAAPTYCADYFKDQQTPIGDCQEAACVEGQCAVVPKPEDSDCTDSDGHACTEGRCGTDGQCSGVPKVKAGSCFLAGEADKCVAAGTVNKANECEICDPSATGGATAWSPKAKGAACAPDELGGTADCTLDQCDGAGKCEHPQKADTCLVGATCYAKDDADADTCRTCQPDKDAKALTPREAGSACTKYGTCRADTCDGNGTCTVVGVKPGFCFIGALDSGTCVDDQAANPANPCQRCDFKLDAANWTLQPAGHACKFDDVPCTVDACDGQGTCKGTPDDEACNSFDGACVTGHCDLSTGCGKVNLGKDVTCTGADGVACTVEHCDGSGKCDDVPVATQALCDDGVACTVDACTSTGCTHTPDAGLCADDGNQCTDPVCDATAGCQVQNNTVSCNPDGLDCTPDVCEAGACKAVIPANTCVVDGACVAGGAFSADKCQTCDPAKSATAWSSVTAGTACVTDDVACTNDLCDGSGKCAHTVAATACLIDGKCQNANDKTTDECQICDPAKSQSAWTLRPTGTACVGDGVGCTVDTCDATGACQHQADHGKCSDPYGCTANVCDVQKDCQFVDNCAFGHFCDKDANACLTGTPGNVGPVTLVTQDAANPNPTNPAVVRHVFDSAKGYQRTWVLFQSQACATAEASGWKIGQAAALRAVVLDQVEGTDKGTPPVVTLAQASQWGTSTGVCQGFPVVAPEPEAAAPGQAWAAWLEADVKAAVPAGCLTAGGGHPGVLRLARLDGAAVKSGEAWGAAAGAGTCASLPSNGPLMLTQGFGLMAAMGNALTDPALRGVVSVRQQGSNLSEWGTSLQLRTGPVTGGTTTTGLATFSKVHPVLVDLGKEDKNGARYYAVAFTEKKSGTTTTRKMWALPIKAAGGELDAVDWLTGTTADAGGGTGDLAGVTAVCSVDAAVDASGEVGVAMVVRKGTKNQVLLARVKDGVAVGAPVVVKETTFNDGDAVCQYGVVGARVTSTPGGWFVLHGQTPGVGDPATIAAAEVSKSGGVKLVDIAAAPGWTTDVGTGTGLATLAWRGLAAPRVSADGVVSLVYEAKVANKRAIVMHAVKPK